MRILNAIYIKDYIIDLLFDDGKYVQVDFFPELHSNPVCAQFLDLQLFQAFNIENGNIVWGNNWDMIFTPESLYHYQPGQKLSTC